MPEAPASPDLGGRLRALIARDGPIPVARWMALCNSHYYATRDPLGRGGDFITAPEISQMFGELIGLWGADLWQRSGRPALAWVELGPGRGTLTVDALRAVAGAGLRPPVHLVETSPMLRAAQAARLPHAVWHDTAATLPDDAALIVVANEFIDALPVHQSIATADGWRERAVARDGDGFAAVAGGACTDAAALGDGAAPGTTIERCSAGVAIVETLGRRIAAQGGAMLLVDYGYLGPAVGDTLQAVRGHRFADPFAEPGDADLTCHVDFAPLATAAHAAGCAVHGPTTQGAFLDALGIAARAVALASRTPARIAEIEAARARLVDPHAMGDLFKVLAVTAPGWPVPAGFQAQVAIPPVPQAR